MSQLPLGAFKWFASSICRTIVTDIAVLILLVASVYAPFSALWILYTDGHVRRFHLYPRAVLDLVSVLPPFLIFVSAPRLCCHFLLSCGPEVAPGREEMTRV